MFNDLRGEVVVPFGEIGEIIDHQCYVCHEPFVKWCPTDTCQPVFLT